MRFSIIATLLAVTVSAAPSVVDKRQAPDLGALLSGLKGSGGSGGTPDFASIIAGLKGAGGAGGFPKGGSGGLGGLGGLPKGTGGS